MKAGAEPKKVAILAGLLVVAGVVLYFDIFSSDTPSSPTAPRVAANPTPAPAAATRTRTERRRKSGTSTASEFKIRQGVAPGEPEPDPATIDPTLRLDLLAKLQGVEAPASFRNIFQYGAAPPPPGAAKPVALPKNTPKISINQPAKTAGPAGPPPPPQAPRMTFKYYGYKISRVDGRKEAFLLDGDDIIIAGENDSLKRGRYKVVKIGLTSITVEDTQFKSTQTLPLAQDAAV